jgi:formylglycine-generating enzyme required for sulfatase activity
MGPATGSHSSGDLQQLLRVASSGKPGDVEAVVAVCREYLAEIARRELPDRPDRDSAVQILVDRVLVRIPSILAARAEITASEFRAELRHELLDQQRTITALSGPAAIRAVPTTDHPEAPDSLARASPAGVQTEPATSGQRSGDENAGRVPEGLAKMEGFENLSHIGGGGMGLVYRAWQVQLRRWVALKCLPRDFADNPDRLQRFRQEVLLAAGLAEPGIVQVYEAREVDGAPVLVLPYVDGCDLNKIIAQRRRLREGKQFAHPHPQSQKGERDYAAGMLPFFDRILDALVGLHGAGVLHRDLKPSNILVDKNGNGWLTDFGLARLVQSDAAARQGKIMGTPGFMSPEQWDDIEHTDARADVFAVGVTICETLTLELPYGTVQITAATPPAKLAQAQRRFLPPHLDLVLQKAIHPDRQQRYQTVADLRDDWQRVRKGQLPRKVRVGRGRRLLHLGGQRLSQAIAAVAVGLLAVLAVLTFTRQPSDPKQPRTVRVTTGPAGARVALVPLDPVDGTLQFAKALQPADRTPLTVARVPPGDYLVVVEVAGHGFHEVYRRVPEVGEANPTVTDQDVPMTRYRERDGVVELPEIAVPKSDVARGMQLFPGGEFTMGSADYGPGFAPPHARTVDAFYLDATEVTVAAYRNSPKVSQPSHAPKALPPQLVARSPKDGEAVRFVNYYQAAWCAELLGKRLPDEAEYEFAATNAGRDRFPWGDASGKIETWPLGLAGSPAFDRALSNPAVGGLYSNVAEWTNSWNVPYPGVERIPDLMGRFRGQRIVRGAPPGVVQGDPWPANPGRFAIQDAHFRQGIDRDKALPGLGFRCARSARPRFPPPAGSR